MFFWSLSGAHNSGSKQIDNDDGNEDMWVFSHDLPLPQLPTRILKDLGCTIHYMFIHFHCTIYIHAHYTVSHVSQCEQQVALKRNVLSITAKLHKINSKICTSLKVSTVPHPSKEPG